MCPQGPSRIGAVAARDDAATAPERGPEVGERVLPRDDGNTLSPTVGPLIVCRRSGPWYSRGRDGGNAAGRADGWSDSDGPGGRPVGGWGRRGPKVARRSREDHVSA
jgi:hypothetical protein